MGKLPGALRRVASAVSFLQKGKSKVESVGPNVGREELIEPLPSPTVSAAALPSSQPCERTRPPSPLNEVMSTSSRSGSTFGRRAQAHGALKAASSENSCSPAPRVERARSPAIAALSPPSAAESSAQEAAVAVSQSMAVVGDTPSCLDKRVEALECDSAAYATCNAMLNGCTLRNSASESSSAADIAPDFTSAATQSFPCFDVPLAEVWNNALRLLGPVISASLQSPKWDKRVEALESAVASLEDGVDLRVMAKAGSTGALKSLGSGFLNAQEWLECWRCVCQILNIFLCDKVMPVRLAAHAALLDLFGPDTLTAVSGAAGTESRVQPEEVQFVLGVLLCHPIDRLGDSSLRLHESARKCVVFAAEQDGLLGLRAVLERLRDYMAAAAASDSRKVHFGVLDAVYFLLERSGMEGDEIDASDKGLLDGVSVFVVAGLSGDSLGPRVRDSAVKLAVLLHGSFGTEAMQPLLAGLRPAKQQLLREKFEESEWNDDDAIDGDMSEAEVLRASEGVICGQRPGLDLTVCGQRMLPPLLSTPALPRVAEESFMDDILEDAGMVFAGADACALPGQVYNDLEAVEEAFEEQAYLEQQLRELGVELDDVVSPRQPNCPSPSHICRDIDGDLSFLLEQGLDARKSQRQQQQPQPQHQQRQPQHPERLQRMQQLGESSATARQQALLVY